MSEPSEPTATTPEGREPAPLLPLLDLTAQNIPAIQKFQQDELTQAVASFHDFREYAIAAYDRLDVLPPPPPSSPVPLADDFLPIQWRGQVEGLWELARRVGGPDRPPPPLPNVTTEAAAKSAIDNIIGWANEALKEEARPKRAGRPKKTEKDSATKVIAALSAYHGYGENGSVTNSEPATNRGLAAFCGKKNPLAKNALSRFLGDNLKGGYKEYAVACHNGRIGTLLGLWRRELPSRFPVLLPSESGREDDE